MRMCPPRVLPLFAYGLAIAMGCAGAGSAPNPGSAGKGGSSSRRTAGTSSTGTAGTTGNAGTSGSAGTTGNAGTAGAAGTSGAAGTPGAAGSAAAGVTSGRHDRHGGHHGRRGHDRQRQRRHDGQWRHRRHLPDGAADLRAEDPDRLPAGRSLGQHVPLPHGQHRQCRLRCAGEHRVEQPEGGGADGRRPARHAGALRFHDVWGTDPSQPGGMCPSIQGMPTDSVGPDVDNATKIMQKYDALPFPPSSTQQGVKFESPASESIQAVTTALTAFTAPGDKYILFITDGQPDYCDDSNSLCAPDSVIARIQAAKTANISTIVLGLQTMLFDFPAGILDAYATAGNGEPTVAPLRSGSTDTNAFYDQCNGIAGWKADLTALGKTNARGTTLGTYSTTAGPSKAYKPSASDQTMLVSQLTMALAGVKSCSFDLTDVGGKSIGG